MQPNKKTMSTPKISVIVPVYNAEKSLCRCIDSILTQTYQDFELLLIDDGSKDSSGAICDSYAAKDSRIKVFHKPNGGVSSARNLGIDNAQGEWLTFVDADDWVEENFLENYDVEHNESFDYVAQGFRSEFYDCTKPKGAPVNRVFVCGYSGCISEGLKSLLESKILGYVWCKAYKKRIVKENELYFDPEFNYQEDLEFDVRYLRHCGSIVSFPKIGYYYYVPKNWDSKYRNRNSLLKLYRSLYVNSVAVLGGACQECVRYFFDSYAAALCAICSLRIDSVSRLKTFREDTRDYLLASRLSFPTRIIIYLDSSCLMANVVLFFHLKIKQIYREWRRLWFL